MCLLFGHPMARTLSFPSTQSIRGIGIPRSWHARLTILIEYPCSLHWFERPAAADFAAQVIVGMALYRLTHPFQIRNPANLRHSEWKETAQSNEAVSHMPSITTTLDTLYLQNIAHISCVAAISCLPYQLIDPFPASELEIHGCIGKCRRALPAAVCTNRLVLSTACLLFWMSSVESTFTFAHRASSACGIEQGR